MSRHLVIAAGALAAVLLATAACTGTASGQALAQEGQTGPGSLPRGVTVTGTGRVSGTPDTLTATVGAEAQGDDVQTALSGASEAAAAVMAALEGAGVATEDIQTAEVAIEPRYDHSPDAAQPAITGYIARNLVRVKIRDLDRAGAILQAGAEAGGDATRLHGVSFTLEDNDELLAAARDSAFADARAKAEQYAGLAGRELGELVSVSEQTAIPPRPVPLAAEAAADAGAAVPIQPGQEEVTVEVTVVWALA